MIAFIINAVLTFYPLIYPISSTPEEEVFMTTTPIIVKEQN
jgi:hypothetical protein